ncbi:MAG: hypothetical protein AUI15_23225 [Actinobacteria bacterium 13_2_20CM_2_66_6]|nr:MAG: hypothetical protein AUI15_23225 [Actinobacteria bacterium 13_2_20CM_2_66_6]
MLPPGAGRVIAGGGMHATLKVPGGSPAVASTFEIVVPPGFDVGAHVHLLFIPPGCPHAFSNPTDEPARVLFQAAPSGHEDYLEELAAVLREAKGRPDPAAVGELRRRYDIEQLTALRNPAPRAHAGQS